MYLNFIGLGLLGMFVAVLGYYFHFSEPLKTPERYGLLVAQDTGKTKHIQSKTGDASLSIENVRRQAIQNGGKRNIRESRTQFGSTTGALEVFFISRICPCTCPPIEDIIFDGGAAIDEYCPVHNGQTYDAGGADTKVCGI
jgi:hypothetical protein